MKTTIRLFAVILTLTLMLSAASCAKGNAVCDNESSDDYYSVAGDIQNAQVESSTSKPSSAGSANLGSATDGAATQDTEFATKIIKNVRMETETKEYDKAIKELDRLINEHGGFIESASSNGQSLSYSDVYRRSAKYTIRIPAENLNNFLSATDALLNVTYSYSDSQNVTPQYYDLQARLEVLRTERDALNGMLEKAENVNEMLSIRDRLYNVIEEIEASETQLRLYDSLVSYSTVNMTIDEVVEYTKIVEEEPTWGERLVTAFKESWQDFAEGFQNFTVGLLYAIPTLLTLGVIGGIAAVLLVLIARRQKRIRAAKRAEWQATHPAQNKKDDNTPKN